MLSYDIINNILISVVCIVTMHVNPFQFVSTVYVSNSTKTLKEPAWISNVDYQSDSMQ